MRTSMRDDKNSLNSHIRQLDALSPLKVMQRGYSLVYDEKEASIIKSITQVQPGDILNVRMTDGQVNCQVWSMKGEEDDNEIQGQGN